MISVVLPTYNEEENIEEVIQRVYTSLKEKEIELIVVDDDSPDGTCDIVDDLSEDYSNLYLIRRTEDRGLAKSVVRGINEANGERIIVMDSDLQHPPEKLPQLAEALKTNDIVVGSRKVEGGEVENWPVHRRLVSIGAEGLARLFLSEVNSVKDILSGFFGVRKEVVEGVEFDPIGYKILLEILVKCDYSTVKEVPYTFEDREKGSSSLGFKQYVEYLRHLFRLFKDGLFR